MSAGEGAATYLAHALSLSALHGPGPWPSGGSPLPDERPDPEAILSDVVFDGIRTHHFGFDAQPETAAELAERISETVLHDLDPSPLGELFAEQSVLPLADDLVKELRTRRLPREKLRSVALHVVEHATRGSETKLGIVLLGICGDERDRELLLLLGSLETLTLYAVVALSNTQPDPQRAAFELAQRVEGWGRIHAVERLEGCGDPEIKAWLLREGFRNHIMNEYLAHIAATTGGLYEALLSDDVDAALLDGAADILSALAMGGPAKDMAHYDDAVPAMHRFAELADARPTLSRLDALLTLSRLLDRTGFSWPEHEPARLKSRYEAVLSQRKWHSLVSAHLVRPVGEYGFTHALSCAGRLGVPATPHALGHLEKDPYNAYVWQWLLERVSREEADLVVAHAERLLPLGDLASGPAESLGFGEHHAPDQALGVIVRGLEKHPGAGHGLLRVALSSPVISTRNAVLMALEAWPSEARPPEAGAWLTAAGSIEPDPRVRERIQRHLGLTDQGLSTVRTGVGTICDVMRPVTRIAPEGGPPCGRK
ncbi:hypothetical protein [Actinocorallia libanotica]|uniref:HEAT repeat protein n=1 Tax=Actinocorallia libanotica TaxID=46162 RepID=A0ABN1R8V9_9ACTN